MGGLVYECTFRSRGHVCEGVRQRTRVRACMRTQFCQLVHGGVSVQTYVHEDVDIMTPLFAYVIYASIWRVGVSACASPCRYWCIRPSICG